MYFLATGTDLVTLFIGLELMALSFYVMVGFLRSDKRSNEAAHEVSAAGGVFERLPGVRLLGAVRHGRLHQAVGHRRGHRQRAAAGTRWSSWRWPPPPSGCSSRSPPRPSTCGRRTLTKARPPPSRPIFRWLPKRLRSRSCCASSWARWRSRRATRGSRCWPSSRSLTMTVGNLAAINQTNIKRLLAYSSISHAGYMLLGLVAGNETGINGIAVYIMVYTFMNLGAFLVLVALRRQNIIGEDMDDIAGLMQKSPGYAVLMLIFLLSLAGIPPTAGFLGKYYIFLSLIETGHYTLAVIATLYVAVAIYYYFRIVRSMFVSEMREKAPLATSFGLRAGAGRDRRDDAGDRHLPGAVPAAGADFAVAVRTLCMQTVLSQSAVHADRGDPGDHRRVPAGGRLHRAGGAQGAGRFPGAPGPHARGPARPAAAHRRRAQAAAQGRHHPHRCRQGHLLVRAGASPPSPALTAFAVLPFARTSTWPTSTWGCW